MHSAPVIPNYLGLPFQILVSPFVRFDAVARVTDIMMFNSKNLGALIVQDEPHVQAWEDAYLGIQNMSISVWLSQNNLVSLRSRFVCHHRIPLPSSAPKLRFAQRWRGVS